MTRYHTLHKQIRQYSRTNKRTRLKAFLREGADLSTRHQSFDFFRRIRTLCPKQRLQCIHIFDSHGQPLSPQQELDEFVQYFGNQFNDPDFQQPDLPPLQVLPFDEAAVYEALRRMPAAKVVAPPSLPAIVWKVLAPELASSTYHALAYWWSVNPPKLQMTGRLDGCTSSPNRGNQARSHRLFDQSAFNILSAKLLRVLSPLNCCNV